MAESIAHQVGRRDRWLLGAASVWAAGLILVAYFAPLYSSTNSSSTLVDENGLRAVILMSVPFVAVLVVAAALHYRWERSKPGAGVLAWAIVVLLGLFNLVGMMSIGVFILPVTGLLIATCARSG